MKKGETDITGSAILTVTDCQALGLKAYRLFAKNTRLSACEEPRADLFVFPAEGKTCSEQTEDPGKDQPNAPRALGLSTT